MSRLRTYWRLGLVNILRVVMYRWGLKSGWHPAQRLVGSAALAPYFRQCEFRDSLPPPNQSWDEELWWFGWRRIPHAQCPPDWFDNPFTDAQQPNSESDWWGISDFDAGDIKGLWELSRFNWVVAWATTAVHGDSNATERLNQWLEDWSIKNPPYKGPNWKCGQEAAIRVMHLVIAAWLLGQDRAPEQGLIELLRLHLQRIAATESYAIAQQNNHGTSEAAALFMGGSFLVGYDRRAKTWMRRGRQSLEQRASELVARDGSFSQYSVTYHRLMLDTYSLSEAWRRQKGLPSFSEDLLARLAAATHWLWIVTDPTTGDAPNLGANDGAHLLQLTSSDYRDFRPSVQLASALFHNADAYGPGPWAQICEWLNISGDRPVRIASSKSFDEGGFHVLRSGSNMAVMRYPRFDFRPGQADCLHVDLWHEGMNLLRDAGSYSYNSDRADWYSSASAHNTIEFDCRDQMPRLGRFLFSEWLKAAFVELVAKDGNTLTAAAGYRDAVGAQHRRHITLTPDALICKDEIAGNFEMACLRWRLAPGDWQYEGSNLRLGKYSISIEIDGALATPTLGITTESRYYQHEREIQEATVQHTGPATIITRVNYK